MTNEVLNSFGLRDAECAALCSIFSSFHDVQEAIIYGSRAKGNYHSASDIDITLKGENLTLSQLFSIENSIDDLLMPYKTDLSIYHHIDHPDLLNHIQRVGKLLYRQQSSNHY